MGRFLLVAALVFGCSSKSSDPPAKQTYEATGKKPANARRATAPPNIEANALAVGAKVPLVEFADPTGAKWRLADALTKHARVMLVFYRGDW